MNTHRTLASLYHTHPHSTFLQKSVQANSLECRPRPPLRSIVIDSGRRQYSMRLRSSLKSFLAPQSLRYAISPSTIPKSNNKIARSFHSRFTSCYTTHTHSLPPSSSLLRQAHNNHLSTSSVTHRSAENANATTTADINDKDERLRAAKMTGQECYDLAMEALEKKRIREEELEEEAAKEQYAAMEKSFRRTQDRTSASMNAALEEKKTAKDTIQVDVHEAKLKKRGNSAANVAVIRTITRQTRSKKKKEERRKNQKDATLSSSSSSSSPSSSPQDVSSDDRTSIEEVAQRYMQYAAFIHGHKHALVRLGNEALLSARSKATADNGDLERIPETKRLYTYMSDSVDGSTIVDVEGLRSMPSSLDCALKLYELAGEQGSAEGWYNRGHLLWEIAHSNEKDGKNSNGSKDDLSESLFEAVAPSELVTALQAFRNAMKLGDGDAAYFLGVQYLLSSENEGLYKHFAELENCESIIALKQYGLELVQVAGDRYNHGGALYYMALLHLNGNEELGIIPCATEDFPQHLDQAADCGDADALFLRSYCLYNGEDGYAQNHEAALEGFIKSGDAGNADGYVSAGAMLHRGGYGATVKQDQRRAFELYQKAAEMGSKEAWRNLVACYALGEGIPKCERTSQYIARTMLNDEN